MNHLRLAGLTGLLLATAVARLGAEALPIHGAISATGSYSDTYNYIGDTAKTIKLNRIELTLNALHRFNNGLAVSAQTYGYSIEGYDKISLDYAQIDYAFNPAFGLRVGRVKNAFGLYGEYQDIDAATPFVWMPLLSYRPNQRAFNAAIDGAKIYGTIELGRGGSFEYQVFGGWMTQSEVTHPFWANYDSLFPIHLRETNVKQALATWFAWTPPIDGLRIGASLRKTYSIDAAGVAKTAAESAPLISAFRIFPNLLPPGVWDATVAGKPASIHNGLIRTDVFVEYTRGDWQYAFQYHNFYFENRVQLPRFGTLPSRRHADGFLVAVTRQVTPRLQLGCYHNSHFEDTKYRDGSNLKAVPQHRGYLHDTALAAAFKVTGAWTVKAEAHAMNGTSGLGGGNGNVLSWTPRWGYYSVKSTITF